MDRASEKTRLTPPLASGDEISYMRHGHNIENDGISSIDILQPKTPANEKTT
jgi:hypothetical protein